MPRLDDGDRSGGGTAVQRGRDVLVGDLLSRRTEEDFDLLWSSSWEDER